MLHPPTSPLQQGVMPVKNDPQSGGQCRWDNAQEMGNLGGCATPPPPQTGPRVRFDGSSCQGMGSGHTCGKPLEIGGGGGLGGYLPWAAVHSGTRLQVSSLGPSPTL